MAIFEIMPKLLKCLFVVVVVELVEFVVDEEELIVVLEEFV